MDKLNYLDKNLIIGAGKKNKIKIALEIVALALTIASVIFAGFGM